MLKQLARDLGFRCSRPTTVTTSRRRTRRRTRSALHQTGKTLSDPTRWKFETDQLYVKSPDEVRAAFADVPDAVANTVEVARRCQLELKTSFQFPDVPRRPGETLEQRLDATRVAAWSSVSPRAPVCRASRSKAPRPRRTGSASNPSSRSSEDGFAATS